MSRIKLLTTLACVAFVGQAYAQEVMIARDASAGHVTTKAKKEEAPKREQPAVAQVAKENFPKAQPVNYPKAEAVKPKAEVTKSDVAQQQPAAPLKKVAPPSVAAKHPPLSTSPIVRSVHPTVKKTVATQTVEQSPKAASQEKVSVPSEPAVAQMRKTEPAAAPKEINQQQPAFAPPLKGENPEKAVSAAVAQMRKSEPAPAPAKKEIKEAQTSIAPSAKAENRDKVTASTVAQVRKPEPVAALPSKKEVKEARAESPPITRSASLPAPKSKTDVIASGLVNRQLRDTESTRPVTFQGDTAFTRLADGFDFPVGKPDAQGYYKARGFRSRGHLGEDWDGTKGGDTDLGDPIYSIGDGVVVFARDCHMGWGNVIIVRHTYREGGSVKNIDALYGHLQSMLVHRGQAVGRGQKIATMGNAHGIYDAHLHLEIRKNIEIGMSRAAFARDFSNYYDPSSFIIAHRHLQTGTGTYRIAMNTFTRDARINFDKARNYQHAHSGGGSRESATALKKAVATQGGQ
jgi:murein DD-endopeptidase MepM/ murein hydrolase activator NlpD